MFRFRKYSNFTLFLFDLHWCTYYLEHRNVLCNVGPFLLKFVLQRTEYYGGVKGVASDLGL